MSVTTTTSSMAASGPCDPDANAVSRRIELGLVWCGPAAMVLMGIGLIPLAQFIPPPHPGASAAAIKHLYTGNLTGVRIGLVASIIAFALLGPWGVAIALQTRRTEGALPALTYVQLVSIAISWTTGVLAGIVWAAAAYRPGVISPEITRALNDLGWLLFLLPWPPFSVWFAAVGLGILVDRSEQPAFPRWAAYLCFWAALLIAPGSLVIFFKTGPFAFNGLVAFYVAFAAFGGWVVVMTVLAIKAINRGAAPATAA